MTFNLTVGLASVTRLLLKLSRIVLYCLTVHKIQNLTPLRTILVLTRFN